MTRIQKYPLGENPKIKRLKRNQPTVKYGSYFDPNIKQIILKI